MSRRSRDRGRWRAGRHHGRPRPARTPARASRCSRSARGSAAPPTRSTATGSRSTTASTSSCAAARTTAALLRRLGVEGDTRAAAAALDPGAGARRHPRGAAPQRPDRPRCIWRPRWPPTRFLSPGERVRAVRAALALVAPRSRRPGARRAQLRRLAATEHGQSPAAVDALWDLIALPTLNLPAGRRLARAGRAWCSRPGLLSSSDAGDVGYARVPLSRPARRRRRARAPRRRRGRCAPAPARPRSRARADRRRDGGERRRRRSRPTWPCWPCRTCARRAAARGRRRRERAARSSGSSPIVNLHVRLRPPRASTFPSPPACERRCSGSSTAPRPRA